ncbi:MAG: glycoside hydrolase family 2 TIM barrel-domain containing protein [Planctomycetota bacterium]|jgi:beta-galactosidase
MRTRTCIDFDWRFVLGDVPAARARDFDDSAWRLLDLPHDWSIEATPDRGNPAGAGGGFYPGGVGWYRRSLDVPKDLGARRVLVEFDGAYMNSEVWCNGAFVGRRPYGYSSFCYDLTPYIDPEGGNVLAVRIDNWRQRNSRWYSGSGIYRHVYLTIVAPVRIGHWGTYVTTPDVSRERATVRVATTIVNDTPTGARVTLNSDLLDPDRNEIASVESQTTVPASGSIELDQSVSLSSPRLWSPEAPSLYALRSRVVADGRVVDEYATPFGIRSLRFDADEGFFLNGRSLKMKGVCEHHDAGCVGAAVPDGVLRRRLGILKDMGCNAIRTSHNPPSPTFLDMCDELGFMVIDEAFDEWRDGKTPFGYQLHWDDWWERDLTDMIRRDRNHPSVVLWSVGNEIKEVRSGNPAGLPVMKTLVETAHRVDPTRPVTCGCCGIRKTNAAGYGPLMDVVGYNGGGGSCFCYDEDHEACPDRKIVATEVPHTLQTRGVYRTRTWYRDLARNPNFERIDVPHLTDEEVFTDFDEHYQSSYDNALVRISARDSWRLTRDKPFMIGEFRWTGFDYIGECYGWPARSWNFGVIDLCGFPKDTYYFYKSQWTDAPMLHVFPHWTWPGREGVTIPVWCYTNCDGVELSLNGRSLGRQDVGDRMHLSFDVEYEPGVIEATGYRGGEVACTARIETAGAPAALAIEVDRASMRADGRDVAHVTVRVVDAKGVLVPDAAREVAFDLRGQGRLIGVDNGDPLDLGDVKASRRRTFGGMCLAIVQAARSPGAVEIRAAADGLAPASAVLTVE